MVFLRLDGRVHITFSPLCAFRELTSVRIFYFLVLFDCFVLRSTSGLARKSVKPNFQFEFTPHELVLLIFFCGGCYWPYLRPSNYISNDSNILIVVAQVLSGFVSIGLLMRYDVLVPLVKYDPMDLGDTPLPSTPGLPS